MAKYTTQLRHICEAAAGLTESAGGNDVEQVIAHAWPKIFSFNFPIYQESHREELCKKILYAYYTREIAFETAGLWKLKLQTKLNLIMPYYNQLFESESLVFDPLNDTNVTTTHTETGSDKRKITEDGKTVDNGSIASESTTNTTSEATYKDTDKYSDTPQGSIADLQDDTYLTNATITEHADSAEGQSKTTGTQTSANTQTRDNTTDDNLTKQLNYDTVVKGKSGSITYGEMLIKYRESMLNIDNMIIEELSDLFFKLW